MNDTNPKYIALYKELVLMQADPREPTKCIEGNNKQAIYRAIVADASPSKRYVWAVYDEQGICVYGGIRGAGRTDTTIWREDKRSKFAGAFFKTDKKLLRYGKKRFHTTDGKGAGEYVTAHHRHRTDNQEGRRTK